MQKWLNKFLIVNIITFAKVDTGVGVEAYPQKVDNLPSFKTLPLYPLGCAFMNWNLFYINYVDRKQVFCLYLM